MTLIATLTRTETRFTGVSGAGGFAIMIPEQVLVNPDGPTAAEAIEALRDALGRISRNFDLLLRGGPVYDVAETRAEITAALAKVQ